MSIDEFALEEYDDRFGKYKEKLAKHGVSPEVANTYDARFGEEDLSHFLYFKTLLPEVVNKYPSWFSGWDIANLYENEITPEQAEVYDKRFNGYDIVQLIKANVLNEKAITFNSRFCGSEIEYMVNEGIDHIIAESYDNRFTGWDIAILHRGNVLNEEAICYDKRFRGVHIAKLKKLDVDAERASLYPNSLSDYQLGMQLFVDILPEQSIEITERFNKDDIETLFFKNVDFERKENVTIEKVLTYNKRFNAYEIGYLIDGNVSPEEADKYDERYGGVSIREFILYGVSHEIANKYDASFDWEEASVLANTWDRGESMGFVHPDDANPYVAVCGKRFSAWMIKRLFFAGVDPERANFYPERFDGFTIAKFFMFDVSPEVADSYPGEVKSYQIPVIARLGIDPNKIKNHHNLLKLLDSLYNYRDVTSKVENLGCIGTGANGIVLRAENDAWKFSKEIQKEYKFLDMINKRFEGKQKNIIKVLGEPGDVISDDGFSKTSYLDHKEDIGVKIEYIKGDTLESTIKKKELSSEDVLRYASDIMNGLFEMRQASIWFHRDIRPANIMVDEQKDRAVIIDFGTATTDKYALQKGYNRRYGGKGQMPNDLVSLGQVMYKMATDEHIFAESPSMELSIHAHNIKDERDEVYADTTGERLKPYLQKVDDNIKDNNLRDLIKSCLIAKNHHYKKMYRMFEKCLVEEYMESNFEKLD